MERRKPNQHGRVEEPISRATTKTNRDSSGGKVMKTWQVEYSATYWVQAESEDEAIEKGMEVHSELPDGDWNAFIDPYDSDNFDTVKEN